MTFNQEENEKYLKSEGLETFYEWIKRVAALVRPLGIVDFTLNPIHIDDVDKTVPYRPRYAYDPDRKETLRIVYLDQSDNPSHFMNVWDDYDDEEEED